jgi:hypothetical protein
MTIGLKVVAILHAYPVLLDDLELSLMSTSKALPLNRAYLVQINGGKWRAFTTNTKAASHVAKNLVNGRRAQVSFHRLNDPKAIQFAFTKEVESLMRGFGDVRFLIAIDGHPNMTSYSI